MAKIEECRMLDVRTETMSEPVEVEWQEARGMLYVNIAGICVMRVKVQHKDQVTMITIPAAK
jgi:hypothetical protein